MKIVILESPYKGPNPGAVIRNERYARLCMHDSLRRGESPMVSHLLYTQVLNDDIDEERKLGIAAGLAWRTVAEASVVYEDLGITTGMREGVQAAIDAGIPVEYRQIMNGVSVEVA